MTELIGKILPGVAEMANLHPMVVHFPIALLNGFILMELLGFLLGKDDLRTAARWMLYLGTLGALAAVAFGLRAEGTLPHNEDIHEILLSHKSFGITVLVLSIILSAWRVFRERVFKTPERVAHIFLGVIMLGVMAFGADKGGLMVYKYGAGVKAVPVAEGHDHSGGSGDHGDSLDGHEAVSSKDNIPVVMPSSKSHPSDTLKEGDGETIRDDHDKTEHSHEKGNSVHVGRDGHHYIKPQQEGDPPSHHHGG